MRTYVGSADHPRGPAGVRGSARKSRGTNWTLGFSAATSGGRSSALHQRRDGFTGGEPRHELLYVKRTFIAFRLILHFSIQETFSLVGSTQINNYTKRCSNNKTDFGPTKLYTNLLTLIFNFTFCFPQHFMQTRGQLKILNEFKNELKRENITELRWIKSLTLCVRDAKSVLQILNTFSSGIIVWREEPNGEAQGRI